MRRLWLVACLALVSTFALSRAAAAAAAESQPFFVYYLTNPAGGANAVSAFRVDRTGVLSAVAGSPFSTGGSGLASVAGADYAHRIVVSRGRNRLFAVNEHEGSIAVFKIAPQTGALSAVPGSPFVVGDWADNPGASLAISNDGSLLYGASLSVVSYAVDESGALSSIGSRYTFPFRINGIALTDANDRLYLTMSDRVTLIKTGSAGLVGPGGGGLLGSFNLGNGPTDVAVTHAGDVLYVGSQGGINAFRVTASSLVPITGTPFFAGSADLSGLTLDFYQRVLVAYGIKGPTLDATLLNSDGSLAQGAGSPIPPGIPLTGAALSTDGRRLVTSNAASQLDLWNIDDAGGLSRQPSYPVTLAVPAGFSKVISFPAPEPTAAPALPPFALIALILGLLSAVPIRRLRYTSACSRASGN